MVQKAETRKSGIEAGFCGVVDMEYGGGGDCLGRIGRRYSLVPLTR